MFVVGEGEVVCDRMCVGEYVFGTWVCIMVYRYDDRSVSELK